MTPLDKLPSPSQRPVRRRAADFQGKMLTLNEGTLAFERLESTTKPQAHLILGLASLYTPQATPSPQIETPDATLLEPTTQVYVLTIPTQENTQADATLPAHWQYLTWEQTLSLLQQEPELALWWYKQNMQLLPHFWNNILGYIRAQHIKNTIYKQNAITQPQERKLHTPTQKILLGCDSNQLLAQELELAFTELGYEVFFVGQGREHTLTQCLQHCLQQDNSVALFFSLNIQGLDGAGHDCALLQALGIPVALWFVDNPWHVLASLRLPWWKQATLLVTDASFIPSLQQEGAEKVMHIPLATAQHMWDAQTQLAQVAQQHVRNNSAIRIAQNSACVFVGRASFPQKKTFFAAARVSEKLLEHAKNLIESASATQDSAHFHWWAQQLHINSFWPHNTVRNIGLGAEQSAQYQRLCWLSALWQCFGERLAVFGDTATWKELLPQAAPHIFQPALDYYTDLPIIYGAAASVLNVTSLLLPQGLTQRHFDVWAAGGFLWTNYTQGLSIFPQELVQPIALHQRQDIKKALSHLSEKAQEDLKTAWQEHLQAEHSYTKRITYVLERML